MPDKVPTERDTTVAEPAEEVAAELIALEAVSPEMVPSGVFSTTDPAEAIRQASRLIKYVTEMIKPHRKDFISVIQGRDFPKATWWTAVGQPLGLSPRTVWVRRREDFELETWEARVEILPLEEVVDLEEAPSAEEETFPTLEEEGEDDEPRYEVVKLTLLVRHVANEGDLLYEEAQEETTEGEEKVRSLDRIVIVRYFLREAEEEE